MSERKSIAEMMGEVLRDAGVLIIVFFPIDQWLAFHQLTVGFALGTLVASAALIAGGIWIERSRR
ncbi:MAG TPA: hypothetical protein VKP61_00635 [Candidatus Acidoferrum sp.]|nr:hypothetical protein [Candidatus Acidoferrum sp.]